jgi:prepilin-type processing-associated H-X9-DG protein
MKGEVMTSLTSKFSKVPGRLQDRVASAVSGFTLLELASIVTMIAALFSVAACGLAHSQHNGKTIHCLSNMNRLATAWRMYSADSQDRIVPVLQGSEAQGGVGDPKIGAGWAAGWLDWTASSDNTNALFLTNERYARLARYVNGASHIFKCPADTSIGPAQQERGWAMRVRSYSASVGLGEGNDEMGSWDRVYAHVKKITELGFPSPAQTFVYVEENPNSLNDPAFFSPHQNSWVDVPGALHNGAAAFSFADGHAEMHKDRLQSSNIDWVSFHTQRVSSFAY